MVGAPGAPGAPGTPGVGRAPDGHPTAPSTAHTPGHLPSWVTQEAAWGNEPGVERDDRAEPGRIARERAQFEASSGEMSRLNWFQRMRQREHLGGTSATRCRSG